MKCMCCRQTGETQTDSINDALFAIKHNPACEAEKGQPVKYDCIDLRVTSEF